MKPRRLLVCASALALLGAGPSAPISLRTLDGDETVIERSPAGPDWVLHFWATWCPECIEEMPELARAAQACDPARVKVVAVNVAEKPALVRQYVSEKSVSLPVLLDPLGQVWRGNGMWGVPANLLWSEAGRRVRDGTLSAKQWRRELGELGCPEP
jgi:thiol-disulfide isomerase/thioredoxin